MERLSRPLEEMAARYQVVVVGSGYGGSIAACRLARAGVSICLLERGREMHPGEYPRTLIASVQATQAHTAFGHFGSQTALYDFHMYHDVSVLVGCGLGGTSLINANVALRPHARIFDDRWPQPLRGNGRDVLNQYFDRAETMLGSQPYPHGWPRLPKLDALQRSANGLGAPMTRPPINVTFRTGPNAAGVEQQSCTLCGDCCTGCNYGSKNTVLMNYLPDAARNGARIFTGVEVCSVLPDDGSWLVSFDVVDQRSLPSETHARQVRADVVILAAGTLGSTEILLRSRKAGLPVSERLGDRFSGNGDVLGFAYDTDETARAIGLGWRAAPVAGQGVGPCITGLIDLSDDPAPDRQLIIEEGVAPGPVAFGYPGMFFGTSVWAGVDHRRGLGLLARRLVEAASLPLGAYRGPVHRSLPYLVMSTDSDHGWLELKGDQVVVRWPGAGSESVIGRDDDRLTTAAEALEGTFLPDPLYAFSRNRKLITVHPLGGCVMGDAAETAVVNHKGQVFKGVTGTELHAGLYVMDGSTIPRPLDVNPLLTISGLAERAVDLLAKDRRWVIDFSPWKVKDAAAPPWTSAIPPTYNMTKEIAGLHFTERMRGQLETRTSRLSSASATLGYDASPIEFLLTIDWHQLNDVLADQSAPGTITGTVSAPALSDAPLQVNAGKFTLLRPVPEYVETWHMCYEMELLSADRRSWRFEGHKVLHTRPGLHGWSDTTTLYVTIRDSAGVVVGRGVMRLGLPDFQQQLRTITVTGVADGRQRQWYRLQFMRMFLRSMLKIYGGPLAEPDRFPRVSTLPRDRKPLRKLRLPEPQVWWRGMNTKAWTQGGDLGPDAYLRLIRFQPEGQGKGPVMLAPGFGMSATSFATETIDVNLPEYLYAHGYDVWLFDYRAGIDLPSSRSLFTIDDIATHDWPAAVQQVREITETESVQALGHCVGSVSLMMALLNGMNGVHSAICAQFTTHIETSWFNALKARAHLSEAMGLVLKGVKPDTLLSLPNELLDIMLRVVPMASEERCGLALCRWVNAIYGCTHRHAELNEATHQALPGMFGWGNIEAFNHFAVMVRKHRAVNRQGQDVYMQHPERMALPTLFLQGGRNYIFHPEGSRRTAQWLRHHNNPSLYRRVVFPGYAHLDALAGRDAHMDVYPTILQHLERTAAGRQPRSRDLTTPRPSSSASRSASL